jgi:hypothetical protein
MITRREQQERWRLPGINVATYVPHDVEIARRDAVRARVQRRQRLARQLVIAIGWSTP